MYIVISVVVVVCGFFWGGMVAVAAALSLSLALRRACARTTSPPPSPHQHICNTPQRRPSPHHRRVVAGRKEKLLVGARLDARRAGGEVEVLQQLEAAAVRVVLAQRRALALGQPLRLGLARGDVVDLVCVVCVCVAYGCCGERAARRRRQRTRASPKHTHTPRTLTPSGAETLSVMLWRSPPARARRP